MNVATLRDRIPAMFELDLPGLLERVAAHATVECGVPAESHAIDAAEHELGVTFPADLRAFFRDFGSVRIVGSSAYDFGLLVVHGIGVLGRARAELRTYLDDEKYEPGWADVVGSRQRGEVGPGSEPFFGVAVAYVPPSSEEEHAAFCARLGLPSGVVPAFFDDDTNVNRFGYRHLVPVIQASSEMRAGVDCVGPLGRMFYFDARDQILERPSAPFRKHPPSPADDTFTTILKTQISKIILGPA